MKILSMHPRRMVKLITALGNGEMYASMKEHTFEGNVVAQGSA